MKRFIKIVGLSLVIGLCVGAMLAAQTPKPPAAYSKDGGPLQPPTIPPPLVTKVFKAQAQLAQAELQQAAADNAVQQRAQVVQELFKELQAACGDKHQPQLDQAGDPVCVVKPASPPKPGK